MTTFELNKPIEAYGEQLTTLTLREATVKDLRKVAGLKPHQQVFELLADLAAIPPGSVDQLSATDYQAIEAHLFSFLPPSLLTGLLSSDILQGFSTGSLGK